MQREKRKKKIFVKNDKVRTATVLVYTVQNEILCFVWRLPLGYGRKGKETCIIRTAEGAASGLGLGC